MQKKIKVKKSQGGFRSGGMVGGGVRVEVNKKMKLLGKCKKKSGRGRGWGSEWILTKN